MKSNSKSGEAKVVDFASVKKQQAKKRYADLVMEIWDKFERADKRQISEKKAEVRFKAKEQL